jgi:hypothetical protein
LRNENFGTILAKSFLTITIDMKMKKGHFRFIPNGDAFFDSHTQKMSNWLKILKIKYFLVAIPPAGAVPLAPAAGAAPAAAGAPGAAAAPAAGWASEPGLSPASAE